MTELWLYIFKLKEKKQPFSGYFLTSKKKKKRHQAYISDVLEKNIIKFLKLNSVCYKRLGEIQ